MHNKIYFFYKVTFGALLVPLLLSACATRHPPKITTPEPARISTPYNPVVSVAVELLGSPYRRGGNTKEGFDCSGFVQYVYEKLGIYLPRTSAAQFEISRKVTAEELKPGDLLFFKTSWFNEISHVGIYIESSRFIHAPSSGRQVCYADLRQEYWSARLVGIGRIL